MSNDPTRLFDDGRHPVELRETLRSTADETLHPHCDVEAGARRLEAAIRSGAIPPEPPVPGPILLARLYKPAALGLGIGLVGLASLLIVPRIVRSHRTDSPIQVAHVQAPDPAPSTVTAAPIAAVPTIDRVAVAPAAPPSPALPVPEPIVVPPPRDHVGAHATVTPTTPVPAWRAEMLQLERARSLLHTDPAAALSTARAGQRAFPTGLYGEERDAIEIQALDALGRSNDVRVLAERFLARHPRGPFSERVRGLSVAAHRAPSTARP